MSQTVKFVTSIKEPKNAYTDFNIEKTIVLKEKIEATYNMNSMDSVQISLAPISNLYVAVVSATVPVTVSFSDSGSDYTVFNGYYVAYSPSTTALLSIDRLNISCPMDEVEVSIGIFGV